MIQKILKARNIGDMLRYLLGPVDSSGRRRPRAEIIDSVFAGHNEWELTREISAIAERRPALKRNMFHSVLRLSPRDRHVSDQEWSRICRKYVGELGFDTFIVVSHDDHVHILCPRVRLDAGVVSDSHDFVRGERIVRQVEREFGLEMVRPSHMLAPQLDPLQMRSPSAAHIAKSEKEGTEPPIKVVQRAILEVLEDGSDIAVDEFERGLSSRGIKLVRRLSQRDGRQQFAFVYGGRTFGPRALGGQFSADGLSRIGLNLSRNASPEITATREVEAQETMLRPAQELAVSRPLAIDQRARAAISEDAQTDHESTPDLDVSNEGVDPVAPRPF